MELKIGQILKNYKEVCVLLGVTPATGNAKIAHIKEFDRYCKYHKDGNKFIIDEVYNKPIDKADGRKDTEGNNIKYANDIETVMLYTLQNKSELNCTISQALLLCQLVNENYAVGRKDIPTTSKVLNLDEKNVYMFYDNTSRRLKDTFERALNKMCGKALISYTKDKMVAYNKVDILENELGEPKLDQHGKLTYTTKEIHRKATREEIEIILKCESDTLVEMGCVDKQSVFLSHRWNEFTINVTTRINNRLNIKYYYESYNIIVNTKHVDWTIKKRKAEHTKTIINYTIYESLINSMNKADLKIDDSGEKKYSKKFIEDTRTLVEVTINNESDINLKRSIIAYKKDKHFDKSLVADEGIPF